MDSAKEQKAIERLKAFEPADGYYLAYSGGKDSDCIKVLAQLAGVKFEAVHNLTTIDAPETVRYVQSLPDVRIDKAYDKNGNKIFERDLCLCDRNISKHIDKKVFEIKFDPEAGFFGESDTSNIYPSDFYMCEIIGNVFDTPEFLKAGEMP